MKVMGLEVSHGICVFNERVYFNNGRYTHPDYSKTAQLHCCHIPDSYGNIYNAAVACEPLPGRAELRAALAPSIGEFPGNCLRIGILAGECLQYLMSETLKNAFRRSQPDIRPFAESMRSRLIESATRRRKPWKVLNIIPVLLWTEPTRMTQRSAVMINV
jgi:hypothetical protein